MLNFKKCTALLFVLLPLIGFSQIQTLTDDKVLLTEYNELSTKRLQAIIYHNSTKPMQIQIGFDNFTGKSATVIIKNAKNTTLYERKFSHKLGNVTLKLNTSNLPDGIYSVIVQNKENKIVKTINVSTKQVHEEKRIALLDSDIDVY
jgi:hypothetical protein